MTSPAAVLAEWRDLAGPEFECAQAFLRPKQRFAATHPCTNHPRCGCRHEVVELDDGRIIAPCRCDHEDCPTLSLTPADVVVHELHLACVCDALRNALGFDAATAGQIPGATNCHRVGTRGPAQTPAVLCLAHSEPAMLAEVGGLCAAIPNPFILLTPTGARFTPRVEAAVRRHGAVHIPLARFLALGAKGRFTVTQPVEPALLPLHTGERWWAWGARAGNRPG
jgi:hypothetical protein